MRLKDKLRLFRERAFNNCIHKEDRFNTIIEILCVCVYCYLTQLCYSGDGGFAWVFSIHGVLFEEQEYLVIFWVIALRNEVNANKPGIWHINTQT